MGIFKKGSKIYGMMNFKCPTCHEGNLFKTSTFSFQKSFEMPDQCPNCGQTYMPEPGFYFGAMFISYIFMGFFCIGFVAILHWGFGWSIEASFGLLILIYAIFFVWIFRMARSIWINLMVKYDPSKARLNG